MGLPAIAVVAAGAISTGMQLKAGREQARAIKQQGEYNAQVYEQQAGMIQEQKKLQEYQSIRARARMRGAGVARTAGAGFEFGGSPLALAIDNETQMLLDQAVGDYNYDVQTNYARSAATASRANAFQQAKLARSTSYSNAFSTALMTAGTYGRL